MIMSGRAAKRAFRYRCYPSDEQARELLRTFGCVRLVYNRALEARTTAWRHERRRVSYNESAFRWRDGELTLAKMTRPLDIRWSRPLPEGCEPTTVTVSRDSAGRWHVSLLVETTVRELPTSDRAVGVDVGITHLVTLSTGEKVANPRHERRERDRLALAQRRLARTSAGSANRAKARLRVARVHARIADRRRDALHKLTTRLVRENQTVVIEGLAVRNMVRNHRLARAISDAGWSQVRAMLAYKCDWYGRDLVVVDRSYPSSKVCSTCGALQDALPLSVRAWTCGCGATHDRDVNAAKNNLAAGLAVAACGDGVRPRRARALPGSGR